MEINSNDRFTMTPQVPNLLNDMQGFTITDNGHYENYVAANMFKNDSSSYFHHITSTSATVEVRAPFKMKFDHIMIEPATSEYHAPNFTLTNGFTSYGTWSHSAVANESPRLYDLGQIIETNYLFMNLKSAKGDSYVFLRNMQFYLSINEYQLLGMDGKLYAVTDSGLEMVSQDVDNTSIETFKSKGKPVKHLNGNVTVNGQTIKTLDMIKNQTDKFSIHMVKK